jgi:CBS-domain-containing membrane protein
MRVEECMTRKAICCGPDDDVEWAMELMREHQVRRIPVVDDQRRILGIVSMADVGCRCDVEAGKMHETLRQISEPNPEASKPRAKAATRQA